MAFHYLLSEPVLMFVRRVGYHPFYFLYTLITSTEQSMEATQKGGSILRSLMPSLDATKEQDKLTFWEIQCMLKGNRNSNDPLRW